MCTYVYIVVYKYIHIHIHIYTYIYTYIWVTMLGAEDKVHARHGLEHFAKLVDAAVAPDESAVSGGGGRNVGRLHVLHQLLYRPTIEAKETYYRDKRDLL